MAIDSRYIPAFSIEDVLLDKDTGAPLTGGLVYFEQDNQRGVLKPVYQITGTSPNYSYVQLPNPIVLSSIGTFEDSLSNPVIPYFFPYDANGDPEYYYIRVTSSEGVEQFTRQAQPYLLTGGSTTVASAFSNELSNPQFAEVDFDISTATYTYNFNGVTNSIIELAPGWQLDVTSPGVGSVIVSQVTPAGTLNLISNPGTLLQINSTGLSSLILRQRLYGSPNLWGDSYLAASFVAKTYGGTDTTLTLNYSQSDGTVIDQVLVSATLPSSGVYDTYAGSALIPASSSTDFFPDAYVDIFFDLPLSTRIDITSVMLAFTGGASVADVVYDQTSQDRQIDYLFHYYKPQLEFKPIPSLLTGWDFALNPAQQAETVAMQAQGVNPKYIWDQTIGASLVGTMAVTRNLVTGGIQATTANNNEAFYYMQYLSFPQVKQILGSKLACNVSAWRTQAGGDVTCKVFLYSATAAAVFPTLPISIGAVDANGGFTIVSAGWSLIARSNLGTASGTLSVVNTGDYGTLNDVEDLNFNGWELTTSAQIGDTNKFAIVVTFSCPISGTVVVVDSIGLMKGDIATRPAPQTYDQVLQECQYYYEKSYDQLVYPGAVSNFASAPSRTMGITGDGAVIANLYAKSFDLRFRTIKRANNPIITFYSPNNGATGNVWGVIFFAGTQETAGNLTTANWLITANGAQEVTYTGQNAASLLSHSISPSSYSAAVDGIIYFHFTVDARIGVV